MATNNRHGRRPFTSTLALTFKSNVQVSEDAEEAKKEHRQNLKVLMDKYISDVQSGKAEGIKSAKEFVDVIKADLLLMGEATDRTESANTVDETKVQQINTILDGDSPEVASLIDELYRGMNLVNDRLGGIHLRPEDHVVPDIPCDEDNNAEDFEGK